MVRCVVYLASMPFFLSRVSSGGAFYVRDVGGIESSWELSRAILGGPWMDFGIQGRGQSHHSMTNMLGEKSTSKVRAPARPLFSGIGLQMEGYYSQRMQG